MKIDYVQNVETRLKMRSYDDLWKQLTESIRESLKQRNYALKKRLEELEKIPNLDEEGR